jgi:hypothetical protein
MDYKMAKLTEHAPNRPIILHNQNCVYCGRKFDHHVIKTKEHVIGRRFVPKGSLNAQWNLIVNACSQCNGKKADLENDLSAIFMQPDAFGRYAVDDPRLRADATNKALKAISRRTKKTIIDSNEEIIIRTYFDKKANISFNLTAVAQADENRILELAAYHVRGFFYLITYKSEVKTGAPIPGLFALAADARRADWGNSRMLGFVSVTKSWDVRFFDNGADGFFKLWIRRKDEGVGLWAWALEWNHSFRAVGFFGVEE